MSTVELLEQAQAAGVLLMLIDGRLTWEADREIPADLLADLVAQRGEVVAVLAATNNPPAKAWAWLAQLASLLACSPDYLLAGGFVDRHDLAEQHHTPPYFAARLIRTNPLWRLPLEHSEHGEAAEFRDQYVRTREGDTVGAYSAPAWVSSRNPFHAHALGGCSHCCPPQGRYCDTGAELRVHYQRELENS